MSDNSFFNKPNSEIVDELMELTKKLGDDQRLPIPLNKELYYKRMDELFREELNNKHDGKLGYGFFDEEKDMSVKLGFGE